MSTIVESTEKQPCRSTVCYAHLYHADCFDIMPKIESKSIDLILADLPYNSTDLSWDKQPINLQLLEKEYMRILKDTGTLILSCQFPFSFVIGQFFSKIYRHRFIWVKDKCANFISAKCQPLKNTEDILVFSKVGFNKVWNDINNKPKSIYNPQMTYSTEINHRFNKGKEKSENMKLINKRKVEPIFKSDPNKDVSSRYPKELIYFPVPYKSKRLHPTQKPVELLEYLIKTYTNKGMTVLDNTMGSGSTGVAAKMLQRNFIGIEKELNYFEIAQKRIDNTIIETSIFDCV